MTIFVDRKELNEKEDCRIKTRKDKAKLVDPANPAVIELLMKMLTTKSTNLK